MPAIHLKQIEANTPFQKTLFYNAASYLSGSTLTYTYANIDDLDVRPYGNLFSSFNFPITPTDRLAYYNAFRNTALAGMLDARQIVIVEIPSNSYGEMIDGKSIELKFNATVNSAETEVRCFGTYFNFNSNLNNQFSDNNSFSSYYGVQPTPDNGFNSNIAYLFSNEIAPPRDTIVRTNLITTGFTLAGNPQAYQNPSDSEQELLSRIIGDDTDRGIGGTIDIPITGFPTPCDPIIIPPNITYPSASTTNSPLLVNLPAGVVLDMNLIDGLNLLTELSQLSVSFGTSLGNVAFGNLIVPGSIVGNTFILTHPATSMTVSNNTSSAVNVNLIIDSLTAGSSGTWDAHSTTHRFPLTASGAGKKYARFSDPEYNILIDEPVGIAFLDKGFMVITHPDLVSGFLADETYSTGYDGIASGATFSGDSDYTRVHFAPSESYYKGKSIYHEFVQNVTCIAMPNEFYGSTNPTFGMAYPNGIQSSENVYITEVSLYNKFGELIGIGKTSEPIPKNSLNIAMFNIQVKI